MLGYSLAKSGRRVLFLEKGLTNLRGAAAHRGDWAEEVCRGDIVSARTRRDALAQSARCDDEFEDVTDGRNLRFTPVIGSGTGGSSAIFGMAMERFFPADFAPRQYHSTAPDTTLPEQWPVSYDEMSPYYELAEVLYRVRGTQDPLRQANESEHLLEPPSLSSAGGELVDMFRKQGLNPYRIHLSCEYQDDCQICQGYLCPKTCKNDAGKICLEPAIDEHGAELLDECRVLELEANRTSVDRVVCERHGQKLALRGKIVILGAGALVSPVLLLNSKSADWPNGLGNNHDQVGRNLMRHMGELFFVKVSHKVPASSKEFAFNDLYHSNGQKLGTVQSFGAPPPVGYLLYQPDFASRLLRLANMTGLVGFGYRQFFSRRMILAQIMEDLPYHEHRVLPGTESEPQRIRVEYRVRDYDRKRLRLFTSRLVEILGSYRFRRYGDPDDNRHPAHVCGTCRFGDDPKSSVLDANNRVHGVDNLYVADSSFFPSSGGSNPSLTIAANALRVADTLS